MNRFTFVLFLVICKSFCQDISEEFAEKIKEAFCNTQCVNTKINKKSSCYLSNCTCFDDAENIKISDFRFNNHLGMDELFQPKFLCKTEKNLGFKWKANNSLIFIVESRTKDSLWKFITLSRCSFIEIKKLEPNTEYQLRLWGISKTKDIYGPYYSDWIDTWTLKHSPLAPIEVKIINSYFQEKYFYATVEWQPAPDKSCGYEVSYHGVNKLVDTMPEYVRKIEHLFQKKLKLEFGVNYTIGVRSKNYDMTKESKILQIHFATPTCLEIYNNLTKCVPPEPEQVQVNVFRLTNLVHLKSFTYNVKVSWLKPKLRPDNYELYIFSLSGNHSHINEIIPGNATSTAFHNISLGINYEVGIRAISKAGQSKFVRVRKYLQETINATTTTEFWSNSIHIPIIVGTASGVIICGLIVFILLYRRWKFRKINRHSQSVISKFYVASCNEKGMPAIKNLTAEYYIPEIVDDEWQLSSDEIVLDVILGEGAFGVVHKGYMKIKNSQDTEVAIKMLKGNPTAEDVRQFEHEIEIMKSVGSHPHLVSLLGCCSKLGYLGPFLVVEYCSKGDLQTYLRAVWEHISGQTMEMRYVNASNLLEIKSGSNFSNKIYELFDDTLLEPRDLLSFARQIVLAMEYLSSLRVVHRDLAARNVLMCGNRTVKVADFGLSRDVYQDNIYMKSGTGKLPIKWMALESLSHQQYTTQSDVWSFGIVLWEIVTLGGNPYSTIPARDLMGFLKVGYRMECPKNCSEELYNIMRICWKEVAKERPTFNELRIMLEKLLETENCYLSLDVRQ